MPNEPRDLERLEQDKASDAERRARERAEAEAALLTDYVNVFTSPAGQRVYADMRAHSYMDGPVFVDSGTGDAAPYKSAIREGWRLGFLRVHDHIERGKIIRAERQQTPATART